MAKYRATKRKFMVWDSVDKRAEEAEIGTVVELTDHEANGLMDKLAPVTADDSGGLFVADVEEDNALPVDELPTDSEEGTPDPALPTDSEEDESRYEAADLTVLDGLGPSTERKLNAIGIYTLDQLLEADTEALTQVDGVSEGNVAKWRKQIERIQK